MVRVVAVLVSVLCVAPAAAQTPREELLQGVQALQQGDAKRAATLFRRVYNATRVPIALYGLGAALRRLGRDEEAARALEAYIAAADPERFAARVARARAMLRELRATALTEGCALGSACLGPVLSLGAPRIFGIGLELRASRYIALAAELRLSPEVDYGAVDLGGRSLHASLRVHPAGNAFFLAAGPALEHISGSATTRGVLVEGEADAVALVFGAGVSGRAGLVLGFDANVVVDVARSDVELRIADDAVPANVDANAVLDRVRGRFADERGEPPLILQANLRLGYLF